MMTSLRGATRHFSQSALRVPGTYRPSRRLATIPSRPYSATTSKNGSPSGVRKTVIGHPPCPVIAVVADM